MKTSTKPLTCPQCGGHEITEVEMIQAIRRVIGIDDDGITIIEGEYRVFDEGGGPATYTCGGCYAESDDVRDFGAPRDEISYC